MGYLPKERRKFLIIKHLLLLQNLIATSDSGEPVHGIYAFLTSSGFLLRLRTLLLLYLYFKFLHPCAIGSRKSLCNSFFPQGKLLSLLFPSTSPHKYSLSVSMSFSLYFL